MDFLTTALVLAWVAIILLALVVSRLIQQVHQLSGRSRRQAPAGLPPGWPAPGLAEAPGGDGLVLLFLSPSCGTCTGVLADADAWSAERTDGPAVRVMYAEAVPSEASGVDLPVLGEQAAMFERYDVLATPFAVVVDGAGKVVRSEPLGSRERARLLLASLEVPRSDSARYQASPFDAARMDAGTDMDAGMDTALVDTARTGAGPSNGAEADAVSRAKPAGGSR